MALDLADSTDSDDSEESLKLPDSSNKAEIVAKLEKMKASL